VPEAVALDGWRLDVQNGLGALWVGRVLPEDGGPKCMLGLSLRLEVGGWPTWREQRVGCV
jgi:hypothetical protein